VDIDDSGEFGRRLMALAEIFDKKITMPQAALYFEALRDVPFPKIAAALNHAAKSCTFFPRPAELRTFALGDAEDVAEQAWIGFRAAMTRIGQYSSLVVRDPALGEAILALFGSWPAACQAELSPEMWASKRKEFGRVYRVVRQRQLEGARYLPGVSEQQNAGRLAWAGYAPVGVLERDGAMRTLAGRDAERERQAISAATHGLQQIASLSERVWPTQLDEAR
jgi:hypothetical protein